MTGDPDTAKAEIVIIRRKGGGDGDGHHGGAWKIAYADFVTAMMAFFLVMWLINASNEATRAQVASYFNPIKLTDTSTSKRGLTEPKETFKKKQEPGKDAAESEEKPSDMAMSQEDKLMHDPMQVLESLAAKDKSSRQDAAPAAAEADAIAVPTDKLFDPFDPRAWQAVKPQARKEHTEAQSDKHVPEKKIEPAHEAETATDFEHPPKLEAKTLSKLAPQPKMDEDRPRPVVTKKPDVAKDESRSVKPEEAKPDKKRPESEQADKPDARTIAAANAIRAQIMAKLGAGNQQLPANLDVKPTMEGVLVSLTDRHEFGMFAVGSAEPDPRLVTLIATIAEVLNEKAGFVVVRGHTDSRPYKNKKYDNWQLSTARAHMAVYMLERGGLNQSKIKRVEGYADRDPRDPGNPESDENRRIDILIGGLVP